MYKKRFSPRYDGLNFATDWHVKKTFPIRYYPSPRSPECYVFDNNGKIMCLDDAIMIAPEHVLLDKTSKITDRICQLRKIVLAGHAFETYVDGIRSKINKIKSIEVKIDRLRKSSDSYIKSIFSGTRIKDDVAKNISLLEDEKVSLDKEISTGSINATRRAYGEIIYADQLLKRIISRLNGIKRSRNAAEIKLLKEQRLAEREITASQRAQEKIAKEEKKKINAQKRKEEIIELKSRVAGDVKTKRKRIKSVKKLLDNNGYCPYCFNDFGDSDIHTDHIYPLSKGGLETISNLVLVCSSCNQKKSDLTLREFIKINLLNRERIETELEKQGKKF